MGYYTRFSIRLLYTGDNFDVNQMLADVTLLQKEIEIISGYSFTQDTSAFCIESGEIKWYDYEYHVSEVSKKYPDWVIQVNGEGEEQGDIWNTYFKNGKSARYEPVVVFPDFNPDDLK